MSDPVEVAVEEVPEVVPVVEETPTPDPAEPKAEEPKVEEKKPEEPKKNHDQRRWEKTLKERAEYKAKAEWLEAQLQQRQTPAADKEGRPARDKFESDEDYVDALTTWKVEAKLTGIKQELAQQSTQSQTQAGWVSKINQARAEYADYDAAMEDAQDIPVSESMREAIQSSDLGGDIAYYLAKNPAEAERINSLSPYAAAREIGRIESHVEYEKTQKAKKPPVSKAPAPIKPVHSSTGTATKSLEDMTPGEYSAYMNKREAERRKRR
jgi:uncharacterized lipoprotein NlpE involved in copper resistance